MKIKLFGLSAALILGACGGGGDPTPAEDMTGLISIAITDASVDYVDVVNVRFTGVSLKPESGDAIDYVFDEPVDLDLLTLQNGNTAELLPTTSVPVGRYNWIRLAVEAEFDNIFDSYAMLTDGTQVELRVPSGSQNGLKLVSGITVTQGQSSNIVIDWDVRKALTDPPGQPGMFLRPALRVTDMASFGTLSGTVEQALLEGSDCSNDLVADTGNAVYIYAGEVTEPADISAMETDPIATATVRKGADEIYRYAVNFLSIGEYTAAFTCQASDDEPDIVNEIAFAPVITGVRIVDGETTTVDFVASSP
jgi:hypothetical protein